MIIKKIRKTFIGNYFFVKIMSRQYFRQMQTQFEAHVRIQTNVNFLPKILNVPQYSGPPPSSKNSERYNQFLEKDTGVISRHILVHFVSIFDELKFSIKNSIQNFRAFRVFYFYATKQKKLTLILMKRQATRTFLKKSCHFFPVTLCQIQKKP